MYIYTYIYLYIYMICICLYIYIYIYIYVLIPDSSAGQMTQWRAASSARVNIISRHRSCRCRAPPLGTPGAAHRTGELTPYAKFTPYRGTSLIRNSTPLGPYGRPMPWTLWMS